MSQDKKLIPRFMVSLTGGKNLGRCYNATYYEVISDIPLHGERGPASDKLKELFRLGVVGFGQEFYVRAAEKKRQDKVFDPEEYNSSRYAEVYIYQCETRVDSSD